MSFDHRAYEAFCKALTGIDFFGQDAGLLPRLNSVGKLGPVIVSSSAFVPQVYRQGYATPLANTLPSFYTQLNRTPTADAIASLEPYCAPIYQLAPATTNTDVRMPLRRFLAVVSNLYRSFLDKNKRVSINVSVIPNTPPLAFFQSNGDVGPYTITSDAMQRKLGTEISVVSLPHSYKQHPIIWASLTHEVCGHDVCHADPELIPELVTGIRSLFKTSDFPRDSIPKRDVLNAMLWSYWIDEAVADVYGLLNMGPTFPFNLAALLSAMTYRSHLDAGRRGPPLTALQTNSAPSDPNRNDFKLDDHPTEILRTPPGHRRY